MAAINWLNATSGNFTTGTSWSGGSSPGNNDDAIIDALGTNPSTVYTVTSSQILTVSSITTVTPATLAITGGIFTTTNGTGANGVNAGTIAVTNAVFDTGGDLLNTGKITITTTSTTLPGTFQLSDDVDLNGGGLLTLSDSTSNLIVSDGNAPRTLTNNDNTISGAGQLGAGDPDLTFINAESGLVNASGTKSLTIDTGGNTVINRGTLQSSSAGGLVLTGTVNNADTASLTPGMIQAVGSTAHVDLKSATIVGGVLSTSSGGKIQTAAGDTGSVLDGVNGIGESITNTGTVVVTNATALTLAGFISNAGTINVSASGTTATQLLISGDDVDLSGGGSIVMTDNVANVIATNGATATLVNEDNTISGAGSIGSGTNKLTFENHGLVNATGTKALTIATSTNAVINEGTLQSSGAGGLVLSSNVTNTDGLIAARGTGGLVIKNAITNGDVQAQTSGSHIDMNGGSITGAAVTIAVGAKLNTIATSGGTIDQGSIDNAGTITVVDNSTLTLGGTNVNNTGTLALNASTAAGATLKVNSHNLTVAGGGKITLTDNIANQIITDGSNATFTNVNNTISGAGTIGNGTHLTLVNGAAGTINASGTKALTITTSTNAVTNQGLLESTGAGGLVVQSSVTNDGTVLSAGSAKLILNSGVTNSGTITTTGAGGIQLTAGSGSVTNSGTISAAGAGALNILGITVTNTGTVSALTSTSHIDLQNAIIHGGTVSTLTGAKLNVITGTSGTISDANIHNAGSIVVTDNSTLTLDTDTITNQGAITLNASANASKLIVATSASLGGAGTVTLTDNTSNSIVSNGSAATFTNINNTISGAGTIGDSHLTVANNGTISATGTKALTLASSVAFTNTGILKTTGAGGLTVQTAITNTGGTIQATGAGALLVQAAITGGLVSTTAAAGHIDLKNGSITGGTVTTIVGSKVNSLALTSNTMTGTINNAGSIVIADNSTLTLGGQVNNTGSITLNSTNDPTTLQITGSTNLTAGGTVTLTDNTHNAITSDGSATLTNVNNTISGAGSIGDSHLTLINSGIINAKGATQALTIDTDANVVTNKGIIEATTVGGLVIASDHLTNKGGIIETVGAGNFGITLQGTKIDNAGGIIEALGSGNHIDLDGATITGGTIITAVGAKIATVTGTDNTLGDISSGGNAVNFTNAGSIVVTDNSSLIMDGVGTNSGSILVSSTGNSTTLSIDALALTGKGKLTLTDNDNNHVGSNGPGGNAEMTVTISGAQNEGDTVHLTFSGPTINNGSPVTVDYLVANGDTAHDIAVGLADAINNDADLTLAGLTAGPPAGAEIDITQHGHGALDNATTVTSTVDGEIVATVSGAKAGDAVSMTFTNANFATPITVSYTVQGPDDETDIAAGLAAAINSSTDLAAAHITASSSTADITITETGGSAPTTITQEVSGSLTTTVGGTITASDVITFTITNADLPGGAITFHPTVGSSSTATTIAASIVNSINTDADLQAAGITASNVSGQITIHDAGSSGHPTSISGSSTGTETFTPSTGDVTVESISFAPDDLIGETISLGNGGHLSDGGTALINVDNTISGAGTLGDSAMTIANQVTGIITANGTHELHINAGVLTNAGLIQSTGSGGMDISSEVFTNNGKLVATTGTITVENAITGTGTATITGAAEIDFLGDSSHQNVIFSTGATGGLVLADSIDFTGNISGFKTGSIDLQDIDFATAVATYTANSAAGGTIVITDGTNTADLTLLGNYVQGNFKVNDDGTGHVLLTDPVVAPASTHYGTLGDDTLTGTSKADYLPGLAGNDTINGAAGADIIQGGDGNDTIVITTTQAQYDTMDGGNGNDSILVSGKGSVTLDGFNAHTSSIEAWIGNGQAVVGDSHANVFDFSDLAQISGIKYIDGGSGNDTITGTFAADDIRGGAGNDILNGGGGNDALTGGAGYDTFVFGNHFGHDTVADFKVNVDKIEVDHSAFADFAAILADSAQVGKDVVITLDASDSITLHNVKIASLHASDFIIT